MENLQEVLSSITGTLNLKTLSLSLIHIWTSGALADPYGENPPSRLRRPKPPFAKGGGTAEP